MKIDLARHFPGASRFRLQLSNWWAGRSSRERLLVATLVGLFLLWLAVEHGVRPIASARAQANADIRLYEGLTARLRETGNVRVSAPQRRGTPAAILSSSAAELGLTPVIAVDGYVMRVTVADAPYELLVRWLAEVERSSNVRIRSMRLDSRPAHGLVTAELTVRS